MTFALFFDSCKTRIADSFNILTNFASEKPNVHFVISDEFIFGEKFLFLICFSRIALCSLKFSKLIMVLRSKCPGHKSASSKLYILVLINI